MTYFFRFLAVVHFLMDFLAEDLLLRFVVLRPFFAV